MTLSWNTRWRPGPLWVWGFVLALGLAVRFRQYFFNASYWYDEAFLILTIREQGFADLLGPQPYQLAVPPMFLWLTRALYDMGGDGELLMRLPAFIAGIGAMILMIPLARRALEMPHAIWAFAFLALGLHAVTHGADVRPYTLDVLFAEIILFCALVLTDPGTEGRGRRWALAGLGMAAVLAPWLSFPSAFGLGGASFALAMNAWQESSRRKWIEWMALNVAVCVSGALMWWLAGRHMYYPGMIEHWQKGWGGFPDWNSVPAIAQWILTRPYEIGNYANRDMGAILALLAFLGGFFCAKQRPILAQLLLAPFLLALGAALIGKYPLAHRTTLFLTPCLYLLAGYGVAGLAASRVAKGRFAWLGVLVLAWSSALMMKRVVQPDPGLDYRGAYQFIHASRAPGDAIWSQTAVVYQSYYGKDASVLKDHEFAQAEQLASRSRLWMVAGTNRGDFREKIEAAGGRLVLRRDVSGLQVLLFEPAKSR